MRRPLSLLVLLLALVGGTPAQADEIDLPALLSEVQALQDTTRFSPPRPNSVVSYPNRRTATNSFGVRNAPWYWPNGKTLTNSAGVCNVPWYWPNGKTMTTSAGVAGANWYWPDGSQLTTNGPVLTEEELLDVPTLAARMLRMALQRGF